MDGDKEKIKEINEIEKSYEGVIYIEEENEKGV